MMQSVMVVKKNMGLKFWHCLGTITWACCIHVVSVRAFHLLWRQVQNDSHCDRGLIKAKHVKKGDWIGAMAMFPCMNNFISSHEIYKLVQSC